VAIFEVGDGVFSSKSTHVSCNQQLDVSFPISTFFSSLRNSRWGISRTCMGGLQQGDRGEQPPEAPVRFDLETPLLLQPSPPDSGRLSQPISRAPLDFRTTTAEKISGFSTATAHPIARPIPTARRPNRPTPFRFPSSRSPVLPPCRCPAGTQRNAAPASSVLPRSGPRAPSSSSSA
jgi:hypothetical protein